MLTIVTMLYITSQNLLTLWLVVSALWPNFPAGLDSKESSCNEGDSGLIPGSGRSPGEGNGTHSNILSGESHEQKILAGYSPMGPQTQTEYNTTERPTFSLSPLDHFIHFHTPNHSPWPPLTSSLFLYVQFI